MQGLPSIDLLAPLSVISVSSCSILSAAGLLVAFVAFVSFCSSAYAEFQPDSSGQMNRRFRTVS
jgi:hypothetical protein